MVDQITALEAAILVSIIAYNNSREPGLEESLEVESIWCLGACAVIQGKHQTPATDVDVNIDDD